MWQYIGLSYSFPNFEPVCCSMSGSNYCFLIYIQVSWKTRKVVWYSHFFKNFPWFIVIHTVKGFSAVSEAEVDAFLEFLCFLYDPTNVGNLLSDSSAFSKSGLYTWKFSIHILLKPSLMDMSITLLARKMSATAQQFEHSLACPSLGLKWKLNFSSPVATAVFSKFAEILSATL